MKTSAKKRPQNKDWYSLKDIAKLFGRSTRFARSLMTKGMPYASLGGIVRIPRKDFWNWLNVEDPGDYEPALISIKELTVMLQIPLAAGYRFKDTIPSEIMAHVGGLWYVQLKLFWEWLSEVSNQNAKQYMEEQKNGESKKRRKQNDSRRSVSER